MNFLEKLDFLMRRDGLNKNTLSLKCDVPYTTIDAFYKKGFENVKMGTIRKIANTLGVSLDYLMNEEIDDERYGLPEADSNEAMGVVHWSAPLIKAYASAIRPTQEAACAVLGIPHVQPDPLYKPEVATCDMLVYTFPAAAGIPLSAEDDYERIEFPCGTVPAGADFGVRIRGDSMQPTIPDDTIVFVRKQPELQNGQIGIFMIDDGALCKRFYRRGGQIILQSDNPKYQDIEVGEYQRLFIVGKVLGYR